MGETDNQHSRKRSLRDSVSCSKPQSRSKILGSSHELCCPDAAAWQGKGPAFLPPASAFQANLPPWVYLTPFPSKGGWRVIYRDFTLHRHAAMLRKRDFSFLRNENLKKKNPLAETTRQDFLGGENVTRLPNSSSAREQCCDEPPKQHIAEICVYCL